MDELWDRVRRLENRKRMNPVDAQESKSQSNSEAREVKPSRRDYLNGNAATFNGGDRRRHHLTRIFVARTNIALSGETAISRSGDSRFQHIYDDSSMGANTSFSGSIFLHIGPHLRYKHTLLSLRKSCGNTLIGRMAILRA